MGSQVRSEIKDCGEPVSSNATKPFRSALKRSSCMKHRPWRLCHLPAQVPVQEDGAKMARREVFGAALPILFGGGRPAPLRHVAAKSQTVPRSGGQDVVPRAGAERKDVLHKMQR